MAFREYLRRRLWVLPLFVTWAFIATDTLIHLGLTHRVSERRLFNAPMPVGDSPTGYQFEQRDMILPYTGMDGYHWIMQTQAALTTGDERVRWVNYDNYDAGPKGREVHWSSSFRWWVALLAWIRHVYTGMPMPIAVEYVMPFANTLLIALLLLPLTVYVFRRAGLGPASMMVLGMAAILPLYESFAEGKSDHHGLAALGTMLALLFVLLAGAGWVRTVPAAGLAETSPFLAWLPDRALAKRWFMASGVIGGTGLWVSTASEAPVLAEIGVAALVATGWLGYGVKDEDSARPDPSLWRVWGWTGAATSVFFYLLEYFPSHFGWRLEVNHPLYAAAWAGGGEIIYRVCRWWNGGKLAEVKIDWLWLALSVLGVCTAPFLIFFFADKVFWVADKFLFLFHEDYIAEFKDLRRYLDPMYLNGSAKFMLAVLNPVFLLTVPMVVWMWRQLRMPLLVVAALTPLAYDVYRIVLFLIPATRSHYPLDDFFWQFVAGLVVTGVAVSCLLLSKWEKKILLGTLAVGLVLYDFLLWHFLSWTYTNFQAGPADFYFWPLMSVPLILTAILLLLWDPWPEFPRPAKAMMMLSLPPAVLTLALATREMRWMEQDYSLWLATLVGAAIILGRLRGYRWPNLPLAMAVGLGVVIPLQIVLTVLPLVLNPEQARWLVGTDWVNWVPWMSGILAVLLIVSVCRRGQSWKVAARTFVAAVFLGAVFLPATLLTIRDWPAWATTTPIFDTEKMEILTRDVSQRLRQRLGKEPGVVVSGPTTTTWMTYWGGFYGLGTLYWENLEGLKADRDIYAAQTSAQALKLIQARGVTHIAIYSWDPFYKEYARLAINRNRPNNPDEYNIEKPLREWLDRVKLLRATKSEVEDEKPFLQHAFLYNLIETYTIPTWLRPIFYPMPGDADLRSAYVLIFEVVPEQTPEEAAVRMAQYEMLRNNQGEVVRQLNKALTIHPDYLPAYICAALFDSIRGRQDEFTPIMQKIRALLPMAATLDLSDGLDLATDFVLAHDDVAARHQLELCLNPKLTTAQSLRRLTVDQLYHYASFLRQTNLENARPGVYNFILTLLPDAMRALNFIEAGQQQKLRNPPWALAQFRRALVWDPESLTALLELARLRATTRDESTRNVGEALDYALKAREKDSNRGYESADVLACAYAAKGQFDLAVKLESEALATAQVAHADAKITDALHARLELFRNQQPYHEPPAA